MNSPQNEVYRHHYKITVSDRRQMNQHKSCVLWLTGLSAAGKSTIANEVEKRLFERKVSAYVLDGDNVRHGLNRDLGFSPEDRKENIRRIGEVAKLFVDAGLFTIAAFISPYREDREMVRDMFAANEFIEVYVKCDVAECERRDPKGLYKRARAKEIKEFTGISAPYEVSSSPEIMLETDKQSIEESVQTIMDYLEKNQYIDCTVDV
ncbi:adenylyl-sulfate kinase [Cohnella sp. LGH]|uniref:adenylyl-sulfate kinase n=1 Tax=Cohnella sp. LGH TaxID=1619153 RepID=UPI001ADAB5B5|nr:adenylyl-sulfate kinase [Cohnella sp. LGH]QTH42337.1 adenylyl-sulfate kinase [Cohnella sp. LGH]